MKVNINRQLAGLEDIAFGTGTIMQERQGKLVEITKVNLGNLPFSETLSAAEVLTPIYEQVVPHMTEILEADTNASIATNKAAEASNSAAAASDSAAEASASATTATTKASEASTSATNAASSAASATTSASTATTKAGEASASASSAATMASTATTKASEASASATNAGNSATSASTSASNAATSASTATTKAAAASASATTALLSEQNALASEQAAALSASEAASLIDDAVPSTVKTYSSAKTQELHNAQAQAIANLAGASASFYSSTTQVVPELPTAFTNLVWVNGQASTNTDLFELGINEVLFKKDGNYSFLTSLTFYRLSDGSTMNVTFDMYNADTSITIASAVQNIDMTAGTKETVPLNAVITIVGASDISPIRMKVRMQSTTANGTLELFSFSSILVAQSIANIAEADAVPTDNSTNPVQSNGVFDALTEKAPKANPVFTGSVSLDTNATLVFEGSSADAYETTLTVVNPTADRTLSLPNESGTLATQAYVDGVTSNIQTQSDSTFSKPFIGAPLFTKVSAASISIPVDTSVKVSAAVITVTGSAYTLSLNTAGVGGLDTGAKTAGTDYYVYALEAGGFMLSANATNPSGYTTANSKLIGGFHYGVIPEAFSAVNNITASDATKIAGINQYSFWDLKFRPICDPSGMAYIFGRWYDLYLCNVNHHTYGTSAAGKTIAGGAVTNGRNYPKIPLFYGGDGSVTYGTFTWFEAAEIAKAHSKDLISYNEFVAIAYGVLEASSASTADMGITQHLANYTSKFGICMATGCQWIWGKDLHMRTDGTGFAWHTETEGRGSLYAYQYGPTAALFGGHRDGTSGSGSRASLWSDAVWASRWDIGCRFACDHLEVM